VANDIRAEGLKVIVENDVLPSEGNQDHWNTGPFLAEPAEKFNSFAGKICGCLRYLQISALGPLAEKL
jgi:hypothetical protein